MPIGITLIVFLLDQLTKVLVIHSMHLGQSIPIWNNVFHFTYILNPGAAFGILEHRSWVFILVALVVLGAASYYYKQIKQQCFCTQIGISLLLGGAAGNLLDRIRTGFVVDFLDFRIWPVFNIADIAICLGAGILILQVWKRRDD